MIFTNAKDFGESFEPEVDQHFKSSSNVRIASGYASRNIVENYSKDFIRIGEDGGKSQLLLGMAFFDGLSSPMIKTLSKLDNELKNSNKDNGVFVCYSKRYHGKIYEFGNKDNRELFLGSSNFSGSGLIRNMECDIKVKDVETKSDLIGYLDFLFNPDNAVTFNKAEIGSKKAKKTKIKSTYNDLMNTLEKYNKHKIKKENLPFFEYELNFKGKDKSGLNVYFGKGRMQKNGYVKPRDWYEIEIIAPVSINSLDIYPKGDFLAFTDDGYKIPMRTQGGGHYYKNIRSKGNLKIFGAWIKGKLEKSGALEKLKPVNQEVIDSYGNGSIKFYKIKDKEYYMEF